MSKAPKDLAHPVDYPSLDGAVRSSISKAISASPKSRPQIAEALSEATGMHITERMLNQFTAKSKLPYRFPAAWVVPFCRITGDDSLQRVLLGPDLADALQIGEAEIETHRLRSSVIAKRIGAAR